MTLYQGKYWEVVFTEWCQEFPGECIISSTKEHLSDLTEEEWIERGLIEKKLESVCQKLSQVTMFNFACLMNNAYRDHEKPHVHFHFIPRYENKREILNKTYQDRHFGYNMWKWALSKFKAQKDIFTKEEKLEIYNKMQKELKM